MNCNGWKCLVGLLLGAVTAFGAHANLILNGDFENHSGSGCSFNRTNAQFSAEMANATAFGTAGEIDILQGACFGPAPQSGTTKVAIHNQSSSTASPFDAFSLDLSSPTVTGADYTLSFYASSVLTFDPHAGPVQVGLSNDSMAFGTLVFTSGIPSTTGWTLFTTTFIAPTSSSFLTVRNQLGFEVWNHLDNFSLIGVTAVPEPLSLALLAVGLAALGFTRRVSLAS